MGREFVRVGCCGEGMVVWVCLLVGRLGGKRCGLLSVWAGLVGVVADGLVRVAAGHHERLREVGASILPPRNTVVAGYRE